MYNGFERDWIDFFQLYKETLKGLEVFSWKKGLYWKTEFQNEEHVPFLFFNEGFKGINFLFSYLVEMYCYAVSAERIAERNEEKDVTISNLWRFQFRNYHIYDFIPRYYSFLDYAAFFAVKLSDLKLLKEKSREEVEKIYHADVIKILSDSLVENSAIGYLSKNDREILVRFLKAIDMEGKSPKLNRFGREYRRQITHRIFPGIDHIIKRLDISYKYNEDKKRHVKVGYSGKIGSPDYKFENIREFAESAIHLIDKSIEILLSTEIMNSALTKEAPLEKDKEGQEVWRFT